MEIEMDGERDARLAALTAGFTAVSGPVQGAVLAFLAAVREAEMRQGEAIASLEQEKATRDRRIEALSSENAGLHGTIAVLGRDNDALRVERESILHANSALIEEREAFQAVENALAEFAEKRRATEAALAAAPLAPDAGREPAVEKRSALGEVTDTAASTDDLGGSGAAVDADDDAGEVGMTGVAPTDEVDVVFRLPTALVDEIDRLADTGRFASRDALTAAAINAVIAPDDGFDAVFAATAGRVDPIGPRAGRRTIRG
jgi:hypothetical protein